MSYLSKCHLTELLNIVSLIIINLISITNSHGSFDFPSSSDCDEYCHKDCSQYFRTDSFEDCVTANSHCQCGLEQAAVVVICLIAGVFFIITLCCCYRIMRHCSSMSESRTYLNNIDTNVESHRRNTSAALPSAPLSVSILPSSPPPYTPMSNFPNYGSYSSSDGLPPTYEQALSQSNNLNANS